MRLSNDFFLKIINHHDDDDDGMNHGIVSINYRPIARR